MIRFIAKTDGKNALNQKGDRKQMGDTFQHRPSHLVVKNELQQRFYLHPRVILTI